MRKDYFKNLVLICFFFSSMTGLIYETLWMRMLSNIFGTTIYAVSTILSLFFIGLALGAYFFGKFIDNHKNPLKIYGILEILIGIIGLLIPFLFNLISYIYIKILHPFEIPFYLLSIIRFLLTSIVIILPTTFMGATFPIISKFYTTEREFIGSSLGRLYFIDTSGATLGVILSGFFLLQNLGLIYSEYFTATLNILIGIISILLSSKFFKSSSNEVLVKKEEATNIISYKPFRGNVLFLLLAIFLSGFASLSYEVLFTRILGIIFGDTIFVFASVLIVFLMGIALGSFTFSKKIDSISDPLLWFIVCQFIIGFFIAITIPFFDKVPAIYLKTIYAIEFILPGSYKVWWIVTLVKIFFFFLLLGIPTFHIGATFPLINKLYTTSIKKLGEKVGTLYNFNTIGGVLGSFLTGFLFIPILGVKNSILFTTLINLIIGFFLLIFHLKLFATNFKRGIIFITILFIVISYNFLIKNQWDLLQIHSQVFLHRGGEFLNISNPKNIKDKNVNALFNKNISSEIKSKILYYNEGITATVLVTSYGKDRQIYIGSKVQASTFHKDLINQYLMGHLPCMLHSNPKSILVTGLGAGITLGAVTRYNAEKIDLVEISKNVIPATSFFEEENASALNDKRLKVIIADGRNFMKATREKYDVITTDAFDPFQAETAGFYTVDYFKECKAHLNEGGVLAIWLPLSSLTVEYNKIIIRSLYEVFQHTTIWSVGPQAILVASNKPIKFDINLFETFFTNEMIRKDFERVGITSAKTLLTFLSIFENNLPEITKGSKINKDSHPILEFSAAKNLTSPTVGENQIFLGKQRRITKNLIHNYIIGVDYDFIKEYEALTEVILGLGYLNQEKFEDALKSFLKALTIDNKSTYIKTAIIDEFSKISQYYQEIESNSNFNMLTTKLFQ